MAGEPATTALVSLKKDEGGGLEGGGLRTYLLIIAGRFGATTTYISTQVYGDERH